VELLSSGISVSWRQVASKRNVADEPIRVWQRSRDPSKRGIEEDQFHDARSVRAEESRIFVCHQANACEFRRCQWHV